MVSDEWWVVGGDDVDDGDDEAACFVRSGECGVTRAERCLLSDEW